MPYTLPTAANQDVEYEDYYESTLAQPLNLTDTDIYPVTMPNSVCSFVVIDPEGDNPEICFYNEVGANYLRCPSATDGEGRGVFQTSPNSDGWPSGTKIGIYTIAAFFEGVVTGRFMRDGFLEARHFSADVDPNNWIGTGETWNYASSDGQKQFKYTIPGDKTTKYSKGMKFRLPRNTSVGYQCSDFEASSSQGAAKSSPAGLTFNSSFTIEAWVWLESYPAASAIVAGRRSATTNGFMMYINNSGQIYMKGTNTTGSAVDEVTSYHALPLGKWVHIAASVDMATSSGKVYINGLESPSTYTNGAATTFSQAGDFAIGRNPEGGGGYWDGKISDVRVWQTVRTAAQIRDNYNQRLVGNETNLVAYYKLSGDFNDSTANNNHLTATGAIATASDSPFSSVEWGILTDISESGGSTTATLYTGESVAPAENLSSIGYSAARAPYGFPTEKHKWHVELLPGHNTGTIGTSANTNYAFGLNTSNAINLPLPIGVWKVAADLNIQYVNTAGSTDVHIGISEANNNFSATILNSAKRTLINFGSNSNPQIFSVHLDFDITANAFTPLYLIGRSSTANNLQIRNTVQAATPETSRIYAECAYV